MERCDLAVERKHELGCNCCQAVLLAFAQEIGQRWNLDEEAWMALGSGFGSGMGGMEATCGALVGAGMVAGLLSDEKVPTVLKTRAMCAEFKALVGAIRCADIKGVLTDPQTGKITRGSVLCSCDNCVRYAVQVAEKYI